ncbi:unnamed protein product [Knipowitschia caucasica]
MTVYFFQKHVRFASDLTGNWSLVIDSVILSDSARNECLQGQKDPGCHLAPSATSSGRRCDGVYPDNTPVTLPCYLHLSRTRILDELNVWWRKMKSLESHAVEENLRDSQQQTDEHINTPF